jgi:hypothetical protein
VGGGSGSIDFAGQVIGTTLKLRPTRGTSLTDKLEWVYYPAAKTITGSQTTEGGLPQGTFNFQLSTEQE